VVFSAGGSRAALERATGAAVERDVGGSILGINSSTSRSMTMLTKLIDKVEAR